MVNCLGLQFPLSRNNIRYIGLGFKVKGLGV